MRTRPILSALLSAVLFGLSTPMAKLLLKSIPAVGLAGILYLGVFLGLTIYARARRILRLRDDESSLRLKRRDIPWLAGAIASGGIGGPVFLMAGLSKISGFSASLFLNMEALFTALFAVFLFKENAGKRVWLGLGFMMLGGVFLTWNPGQSRLSLEGPFLVLLAMACWGLDNNFTRNISDKDPVQIARIKGLFAGSINLGLAAAMGFRPRFDAALFCGLALGALSYGLSLVLFIRALEGLGAFRTGALFNLAPFMGALGSMIVLREPAGWLMAAAAGAMAAGVGLMIREKHGHRHRHERLIHVHGHTHGDRHHNHVHDGPVRGVHTHEHEHEETDHIHGHWPDFHHRHRH